MPRAADGSPISRGVLDGRRAGRWRSRRSTGGGRPEPQPEIVAALYSVGAEHAKTRGDKDVRRCAASRRVGRPGPTSLALSEPQMLGFCRKPPWFRLIPRIGGTHSEVRRQRTGGIGGPLEGDVRWRRHQIQRPDGIPPQGSCRANRELHVVDAIGAGRQMRSPLDKTMKIPRDPGPGSKTGSTDRAFDQVRKRCARDRTAALMEEAAKQNYGRKSNRREPSPLRAGPDGKGNNSPMSRGGNLYMAR